MCTAVMTPFLYSLFFSLGTSSLVMHSKYRITGYSHVFLLLKSFVLFYLWVPISRTVKTSVTAKLQQVDQPLQ